MPGSQELDSIFVKLGVEADQFNAILDAAEKRLVEAASAMEKSIADAEAQAKAAMEARKRSLQEAAQLTEAVATPTENYINHLRKVNRLYTDGFISQETYNRALERAKQLLPETQAAQARANEMTRLASKVTQAVATPTELYIQRVKELQTLLRAGAISQETYNRALMMARKELPSVQAKLEAAKKALAEHNRALERGKKITEQMRNPTEKYQQEIQELNNLLKAGAISQETFNRATRKASKELREADNAAKRFAATLKTVGSSVSSVGRTLSLQLTAPITAFGAAAVRESMKFGAAMQESVAIMGDVTPQLRKQMEEVAKGISFDTSTSPDNLARGFYFLASAGLDAVQSMKALASVEAFATASAMDMEKATELLMDSQTALGMRSQDAEENMQNLVRVSDVLTHAANLSNASVEQFATSLATKSAAAMRIANKEIEEGVAALAVYADQGVKAQRAGEMFTVMLREMQTAHRRETKMWEELNLRIHDAEGNLLNIADIVRNFERLLLDMSDAQRTATLDMLGFRSESTAALMPLIGMSDEIARYERELRKASGVTQQLANVQMQSFGNQLAVLQNRLKVVGIEIGSIVIPEIVKLLEHVKSGIDWFRGLTEENQRLLLKISAVTAVVGPAAILFGSFAGAVSKLSSATILLTAHLTGVAPAAVLAKGAIAGLAVGGIYLLSKALYENSAPIQEFNRELERMSKLSQQLIDQDAKNLARVLEEAGNMAPDQRKSFLEEQLKRAQKEFMGLQGAVAAAERRVQELDTTWNNLVGSKHLEAARAELDHLKERLSASHENYMKIRDEWEKLGQTAAKAGKAMNEAMGSGEVDEDAIALKNSIADLEKELQLQIDTFGKHAVEVDLYRMKLRGATDAQLEHARALGETLQRMEKEEEAKRKAREKENQRMREGQRIIEQYMTPLERLNKQEMDLRRLLEANAIDLVTFNRAMEKAKADFKKDTEIDIRVNFHGIDAVETGSAEMLARLDEFRARAAETVELDPFGRPMEFDERVAVGLAAEADAVEENPVAREEPWWLRTEEENAKVQQELLARIAANTEKKGDEVILSAAEL